MMTSTTCKVTAMTMVKFVDAKAGVIVGMFVEVVVDSVVVAIVLVDNAVVEDVLVNLRSSTQKSSL